MNPEDKKQAKHAKAQIKQIKQEAKAKAKADVHEVGDYSELVISGLKREQLQRLLPQINKDLLITQTQDRSAFKAGMLRFFREGVFQTIIKVIAGLIVGLLLYKIGLK